MNLFSEVCEVEGEKALGYLRGTPGLDMPIVTLPTYPVRALLTGGSPLTPVSGVGGRMFAVGGSKLYEVFPLGGYGHVDTSGTAVTATGGVLYFDASMGTTITINAVVYTIATFTDATHIVLTASAGTQSAAAFSSPLPYYLQRGDVGNDGRPAILLPNGNQLGIISAEQFYCDSGTGPVAARYLGTLYRDLTVGWGGLCITVDFFVVRMSGNIPFNAGLAGAPITINSIAYTVATVIDGDNLTLTTTAGLQPSPVAYTAGVNTNVSSATSPFGPVDVGTTLVFPGGSGWTAGSYTVYAVNGSGTALLSASPGILGLTGGIAQQTTMDYVYAAGGTYLDSYFVIFAPYTNTMQVSSPLDGTLWDAADYGHKESYPDNIGAILADHEELFVWGENRSEVWRAPGADLNFPFQRDPGACMSLGIAAPFSAAAAMQGVCWIGGDSRGQPVAYYAAGYVPTRISTHAVEQAWAKYPAADAIAFTYSLDGHVFWQITFIAGDSTWVYDFTASTQMGKPMWHERTTWDGAAFHRHRASCHCYVFGKHWVGDFANGKIYEMSSSIYTDAGQVMTCQRTLPHICNNRLRQFFTKWQTDLETAKGGVALTIVLEWSDDGGHTFVGGGSAFTLTTSTTLTQQRCCFWQLGSADDRIFRITVTGNAPKALINAYLDVVEGIS